ncbi:MULTISPECIES: hypothetical protein [Thermoanaerobacterium]|uniref:Uncharacterized protein n=2 Tax=Thermoanaerobacterium TaxID=28895 RepID=W9E7Y9_9THEO|nr:MULTISPECIES: hypothetical protein [Thermoanaerobacterium]AFK87442.1 hypothetical protein Tsac_2444 [Thermoanaerobacterium saccharolyticum JW/SL-YS485]ETO37813.1 hypothetical protein V518_2067 [Thermoanaerobacterium aotearoense SCUT27]
MKEVHEFVLTPYEFGYYDSIEHALRDSISTEYNEKTHKVTVRISKEAIEKLIKDNEAFAEIDEEVMEIVWE